MNTADRKDLGYLGEDFQYKLVHTFMEDKEFFKDLNNIIDQNMFTSPELKMYVGIMKEYYEREEAVPSYTMMGIALNNKSHNSIEKEFYEATIKKIQDTSSEGVDYIRGLAEKFFKQQNIVKTANSILRIAGNGDTARYDECVELLNEALNQGTKEDFGNSVFDDIGETLSDDYRTAIPTGIGKVDETLEGGLGKGELGVIIGPSSFGKAQPLDSLVLTPNGFKRMGDMQLYDDVIGRDGKTHKVVGIFPQGVRPIYKLTFSNGATCECDIEHLWTVREKHTKDFITCPLLRLISKVQNGNEFYVPKLNYIDDSYIDFLPNRLEIYLHEIKENGKINPRNGKCVYKTNDEEMYKQMIMIVNSFGMTTSFKQSKNGSYTIKFSIKSNKYNPFNDIKNINFKKVSKQIKIKIQKIDYVGQKEAQCIMIDSDEHLYVTDNFIVTHNTSMTTAMASYAATYKCQQNNDRGYKVLQIVFEDRIKQIQRKHIGRITGIEAKDISKPEIIDTVKEQLDKYEDKELLRENLKIVRFSSGEMTAPNIQRYIKKLINNGFKPDMVIIDYFECLSHIDNTINSSSNEFEKEGRTMRKLEAMAGELDIALWIPTQGVKDSVNMELVTMDKAGGSFKKIQIAHIVMSIARTMEDIESNKATIAILKNRAGKSGKVFNNVEFNNGTCRISTDHVDEFDNMLDYKKNSQKENMDLAKSIFKLAQQKK